MRYQKNRTAQLFANYAFTDAPYLVILLCANCPLEFSM
jgi:hypothetical protein